jgi:poly-gamma-glutamate capsule biosynthesis protein CapA/YwtB (metallophosphatase superfamily)
VNTKATAKQRSRHTPCAVNRRRHTECAYYYCVLVVVLSLVLPHPGAAHGRCLRRAAPPPAVRLVFVGDVMLDDLPGKAVARGVDPFAPFAAVFQQADIAVCNLECSVATSGEPLKGKPWTFRAAPAVIDVLQRHFTAVSVANNHSGDYGKDAFVETLRRLSGRLPALGGGQNLKEAHQPVIFQCRGLRIALLGYNEFHPREFEAGPNTPGIAWSVDEQVVADIQAARRVYKADLVVPFMHWGEEGETKSCLRQQTLAHRMIDAGADLVVGTHPHRVQETEFYKGRLIAYSLGNFVFDGFTSDAARTGMVLRVSLGKGGLVRWDTSLVHIDEEGLPHPEQLVGWDGQTEALVGLRPRRSGWRTDIAQINGCSVCRVPP